MSEDLPLWTVYDHPSDYPEHYVARQYTIGIAGAHPTNRVMASESLDAIRVAMTNTGLVCITRSENDDPTIVEVWF